MNFKVFPAFQDIPTENAGYSLVIEGDQCCPTLLDSTLYWYGIYETLEGDSLIKVKLSYIKGSRDGKSRFDQILTDQSRKRSSKFLIGSKMELKNRLLNRETMYKFKNDLYLYPGQKTNVCTSLGPGIAGNCVALIATGNVKSVSYCPEIENYKLFLADNRSYEFLQDITIEMYSRSECGMIGLSWYGDIDGDQLADMIFVSSNNNEGVHCLFITSCAGEGHRVKKVATVLTCSCC